MIERAAAAPGPGEVLHLASFALCMFEILQISHPEFVANQE